MRRTNSDGTEWRLGKGVALSSLIALMYQVDGPAMALRKKILRHCRTGLAKALSVLVVGVLVAGGLGTEAWAQCPVPSAVTRTKGMLVGRFLVDNPNMAATIQRLDVKLQAAIEANAVNFKYIPSTTQSKLFLDNIGSNKAKGFVEELRRRYKSAEFLLIPSFLRDGKQVFITGKLYGLEDESEGRSVSVDQQPKESLTDVLARFVTGLEGGPFEEVWSEDRLNPLPAPLVIYQGRSVISSAIGENGGFVAYSLSDGATFWKAPVPQNEHANYIAVSDDIGAWYSRKSKNLHVVDFADGSPYHPRLSKNAVFWPNSLPSFWPRSYHIGMPKIAGFWARTRRSKKWARPMGCFGRPSITLPSHFLAISDSSRYPD